MERVLDSFLNKFVELYGKCSPERLVDYIVYQTHKNRNITAQAALTKNAFGKTAIGKFIDRNEKGLKYYEDLWLSDEDMTRDMLVKMFPVKENKAHPLFKYIYMSAEETTKKRCLGTQAGMIICECSTLMWSPFSESCQQCANADQCKVITEKKYPELYRIRVEEYGKEKK